MHNMICVTTVVFKGDNKKKIVCQLSGLVENFNTGIYSDTINVINVKLCIMVLHFQTTFSDLDHISRSQQCQTVLTENVMILFDLMETS